FTNGAHIDSLDPDTYNRWYDFLELFVAHQAPIVNAAISRAAAPVIYQTAMGVPQTDLVTLPADPIQLLPTYSTALAAFEQLPAAATLPPVRGRSDTAPGRPPTLPSSPGAPYAGFAQNFSTSPIPGTAARTWYLGGAGALNDLPAGTTVDGFHASAGALPLTD